MLGVTYTVKIRNDRGMLSLVLSKLINDEEYIVSATQSGYVMVNLKNNNPMRQTNTNNLMNIAVSLGAVIIDL
jgi:predicted  nucleic acid-binding Zn-ribbon protein